LLNERLSRGRCVCEKGIIEKTCYSEEEMLEFLIDNIFVSFGGALFQQVVGILMGTNCAPLLADLFLCSYESEVLQNLVKDKKIHEARAFNLTYRYIKETNMLSMRNSSILITCSSE
jgi:hypothetical protein